MGLVGFVRRNVWNILIVGFVLFLCYWVGWLVYWNYAYFKWW